MIQASNLLNRFEQAQIKRERLTYAEALRLFESMWREARLLKIVPPQNLLEGIESDIRLARILNSNKKHGNKS